MSEKEEVWEAINKLDEQITELTTQVALIAQELGWFRKGLSVIVGIAAAQLGIDIGVWG